MKGTGNVFRSNDAIEFVQAFTNGRDKMTVGEIGAKLDRLSKTIDKLTPGNAPYRTDLHLFLAAYRGYEYALIVKNGGLLPALVTLDESPEA